MNSQSSKVEKDTNTLGGNFCACGINMQKAYYISILGGDVPPCSPNPDPFSDKQT